MMLMTSPAPVRRVLAPDGSVLTLADLPPLDAQRWVASRKAIVVAAVRGGLLSMSDACARYRLTTEEFLSWQTQVDRNGLKGLRATRVQESAVWIDAHTDTMCAGQTLALKETDFPLRNTGLEGADAPGLPGDPRCAAAHRR
jgi:hypothetical protein